MQGVCQCGSCVPLDQLSDEEFVTLCALFTEEVGVEILKQSQREEAVARRLAKDLDEPYTADLTGSIDTEVAKIEGEFDPYLTPELVDSIGRNLKDPEDLGMDATMGAALAAIMLLSRRGTRTTVKETGRSVADVPPDLTAADVKVLESLSKVHLTWIGDLWSTHLSSRMDATVRREALARGLGREDVGKILKGVVTGDFPWVRVPKTWNGTVSQYFTNLAGTVRTHASSFGAISTMADAGVEQYEFFAVMDERTSEVCRYMNGKRFSVRSAQSLIGRMLRAEDPDEFKRAARWRSLNDVQRIGEGGEEALAAAGVQLPPLHGLCRSVVLPV